MMESTKSTSWMFGGPGVIEQEDRVALQASINQLQQNERAAKEKEKSGTDATVEKKNAHTAEKNLFDLLQKLSLRPEPTWSKVTNPLHIQWTADERKILREIKSLCQGPANDETAAAIEEKVDELRLLVDPDPFWTPVSDEESEVGPNDDYNKLMSKKYDHILNKPPPSFEEYGKQEATNDDKGAMGEDQGAMSGWKEFVWNVGDGVLEYKQPSELDDRDPIADIAPLLARFKEYGERARKEGHKEDSEDSGEEDDEEDDEEEDDEEEDDEEEDDEEEDDEEEDDEEEDDEEEEDEGMN